MSEGEACGYQNENLLLQTEKGLQKSQSASLCQTNQLQTQNEDAKIVKTQLQPQNQQGIDETACLDYLKPCDTEVKVDISECSQITNVSKSSSVGDTFGTSDSQSEDIEGEEQGVTLIDMPTEVLLQICSYLSARLLMQTMRLVCKRLCDILSDDFIWRSRIFQHCRQIYPPLQVEEHCMNWKAACINLEEQRQRWSNMQKSMKHLKWANTHIASIDAIMLISKGALCVSGSRDRFLAVFNVVTQDPKPITQVEGHKGWIWGLSAKSDSSFYSCSFDDSAKLWTLDEGKLTAIDTFRSRTPLLSIACASNLVALGSYDRRVSLWDPRSGPDPTHTYVAHRRPVLKVSMLEESGTPDAVLSISEDKTLAVWDLRACKLLKSKILVGSQGTEVNAFPLCMSLNSDLLYVGDNKNTLHLIDPRRDSPTSFQVIASYNAGHQDGHRITSVRHGLGCVITGSSDGTVRVSVPTHPPELITSFKTSGSEVAALDFQHGILAAGCTDCAVELWVPDEETSP